MKRAALALYLTLSGCTQRGAEPLEPQALKPEVGGVIPAEVPEPAPVDGVGPGGREVQPAVPIVASTRVRFEPRGARSLDQVRSVLIDIEVTGARVGAELALELAANQTVDYEKRTVTLTGGVNAAQRQTFELAVAGTMIPENRLSGEWAARFFLDGAPLATQTFGLTP